MQIKSNASKAKITRAMSMERVYKGAVLAVREEIKWKKCN